MPFLRTRKAGPSQTSSKSAPPPTKAPPPKAPKQNVDAAPEPESASTSQPADAPLARPPNVVVSTSRLVSAETSTAPAPTARLTRRQTAALGTQLWFMERMKDSVRKTHVAKLAVDMQLTEDQVETFRRCVFLICYSGTELVQPEQSLQKYWKSKKRKEGLRRK